MKSAKTLATNRGSLLVELCIAIAIVSIVFTALSVQLFAEQTSLQNAIEYKEAIFKAQENIEHRKNSIYSYSTPCLYKVTTKEKSVVFTLDVADLEYARAIDGDCGGTQPKEITATTTVEISKYFLQGTSTSLDIIDDIAVVGSVNGGTSTLQLFSTNITSLQPLGSLEFPDLIEEIDAIHGYAYIAAQSSKDQFKIIDTHNLSQPRLAYQTSLPGVAGSFPGAISIFYYDKKVYIGTHRTAGRELHVYDVSRIPAQWLGSLELNHNINALAVRNGYVYLATSGNTKDLIIVDARNPQNMSIVSTLDITGPEDSTSIELRGTELTLGRKKSTQILNPNIVQVDITDILNPKVLVSSALKKDILAVKAINNSIFGFTGDKLASLFLISSATSSQLTTLDESIVDSDFERNTLYALTNHWFYFISFK